MRRIDANVILRYVLHDNEILFEKACEIIDHSEVLIASEVLAEVVYVLQKVYTIPKVELCETLQSLLLYQNVKTLDDEVMRSALHLFSDFNLDFVDCILCAYHQLRGDIVETFDQGLIRQLEQHR
ncbi:MAG: PIN domain-containing protein [SAR324 cluster bacterium]|nr:PIN domain-containing protein [SAR324 cluster bacterium]